MLANYQHTICRDCNRQVLSIDSIEGLCEFCFEQNVIGPVISMRKAALNWAAECEQRLRAGLGKLYKLRQANGGATHCSCGLVCLTTSELLAHQAKCDHDYETKQNGGQAKQQTKQHSKPQPKQAKPTKSQTKPQTKPILADLDEI